MRRYPARPEGTADSAEELLESRGRQGGPLPERVQTSYTVLRAPSQYPVSRGANLGAEIAEPIYANLIHFPREVVATRKLRPRRAEGPLVDGAAGTQLSIFEVDPGSISTEPACSANEPVAPAWMREEWLGIELEDQPRGTIVEEPERSPQIAAAVNPARLSWRLLATVVDASLVVAVFVAVVALVSSHLRAPVSLRVFEVIAVLALFTIGAIYQSMFFRFVKATPGMLYAGIGLSTFDGDCPNRAQHTRRQVAMLLSVLPLGLGLLWALVDNDLLTWHDRLSGTYLRRL